MPNLMAVLRHLESERTSVQGQIKQLDSALNVLQSLNGAGRAEDAADLVTCRQPPATASRLHRKHVGRSGRRSIGNNGAGWKRKWQWR